jgi:hypothetical protein
LPGAITAVPKNGLAKGKAVFILTAERKQKPNV